MSSSVIFGENSIFAKIDSITSLGMDRKLDKLLGFGPGKPTTQRIGELASQSAKEGGARPIVWGRVRPISGNIMHSSTPRIVRREVKGQSPGGKGGKKKAAKQYEERVFRTYAIRICEGPITGIIRVWRNNKLVYDARGNSWGEENNGVFLRLAKFYLGGWDQMPDPSLESIWGAGEVPGYRGTCYMVVPDEDLTELGGAVPQYVFEVERAEGTYLTSRPYSTEDIESASVRSDITSLSYRLGLVDTSSDDYAEITGASVDQLVFRSPLFDINAETESADITGAHVDAFDWSEPGGPITTDMGVESVDMTDASVTGLNFRAALISYNDTENESVDLTGAAVTALDWNAP